MYRAFTDRSNYFSVSTILKIDFVNPLNDFMPLNQTASCTLDEICFDFATRLDDFLLFTQEYKFRKCCYSLLIPFDIFCEILL